MSADSLRNQFLIAMPSLEDGHFERSVSLLCEHSDEGALGLVINRPTDLLLRDMLDHLEIDPTGLLNAETAVYWGGPVQSERGFVVHSPEGEWESSIRISDELAVTSSKDILSAIGAGDGPEHFLVTLGYAGWDAGQLEQEILSNTWLNVDVHCPIVFDTPADERWTAATRLLGFDPNAISVGAGHA